MPNLDEIIAEKLARLDSVPDAFINQIEKTQREIYNQLLELLKVLKTDGDGFLLPDQTDKIQEIGTLLRQSMFQGEYAVAVTSFLSEFPVQAEMTQAFYTKAFGSFTDKALYEDVYKASINAAADLLNGNSVDKVLIDPVKQFLNQNITSGASYTDVVKGLRDIIEGTPEIDGKLLRHVKLVARDSFAVTDRTYSQIIANDLDLKYYKYAGGLLRDTRDFCRHRAGNIYHKKEIQGWAKLTWQGKNSATNEATIFQLVGGYNCIHTLIPVAESEIPEFVKNATKDL